MCNCTYCDWNWKTNSCRTCGGVVLSSTDLRGLGLKLSASGRIVEQAR